MARTEIVSEASLDTTKFQRGLAKANKGIKGFAKSGAAKFAALAGTAGLGAVARSALDTAKEISNLSKVANASEEELQKIAFGASTVGVSMEKTADIMKDVSDKVGDFLQTGGGPLKDFFENIAPKVGVTAEEFRNLSGPQALQLYVSSLEKANLSQSEMTFFMEAIASDATLLLPLMRDNGKAMAKFADEAERAGQVMDKQTIEKLKKASVEIDQFKNKITILAGKGIAAFSVFSERVGQGAAMMVNKIKGIETVFEELPDTIDAATASQDKFADSIDRTNGSVKDLSDQIGEYFEKVKKQQSQAAKEFLKGKELEVLELRAKGEQKAAEAMQHKIDSMKRAISISEKYGISLAKAAKLVRDINKSEAASETQTPRGAAVDFMPTSQSGQSRGIQTGKIQVGKIGDKAAVDARMRSREMAAGLYNTTLGRSMVSRPNQKNTESVQDDMAKSLKMIERELTSNGAD